MFVLSLSLDVIAYSTIAVVIASSPSGTHILASCSSKLLFDLNIH